MVALCALLASCAGKVPPREEPEAGDFSAVQGKDWFLAEVRGAAGTIRIARTSQAGGAVYSLRFDGDRFSGKGAPNRYFGPYSAGPEQSLSPGAAAHTQMMSLAAPEGLREEEYFALLSRARRWNLRSGRLELETADEAGAKAVLVFTDAP
ncbi:MAG: META domain protein [Treponematales bacterium]